MRFSRFLILLTFVTTMALGQPAHQNQLTDGFHKPEVLVRSLYQQVLARHPIGILYGADINVFSPYLSNELHRRMGLANGCTDDWYRHHPGRSNKPPFAWLELGVFSGGDEKATPGNFRIERTEAEKDGSFRVDVELTYRPSDGPGVWHVEVIVVREGSHLAVDDVIFLKSKDSSPLAPAESRLSEFLSQGCDGPHWVGYGNQHR